MKDYIGKIIIGRSVKAHPFNERKIPELIINRTYFVSFGSNIAYPCALREIDKEGDRCCVTIVIPCKIRDKKGFRDLKGKISYDWNSVHTLDSYEIGWTPKQAVENTVG